VGVRVSVACARACVRAVRAAIDKSCFCVLARRDNQSVTAPCSRVARASSSPAASDVMPHTDLHAVTQTKPCIACIDLTCIVSSQANYRPQEQQTASKQHSGQSATSITTNVEKGDLQIENLKKYESNTIGTNPFKRVLSTTNDIAPATNVAVANAATENIVDADSK